MTVVAKTLLHPSKYRVSMTEEEELFSEAYSIYENQLITAINNGWNKETKGKNANDSYLGGNMHVYLMYYALTLRNKMQLEGFFDESTIECLEKRLTCLSVELGFDYVTFWESIKDLFGLYNSSEDEDCCPGISLMEIDGDDCTGFIIGDCVDVPYVPEMPTGAFRYRAFRLEGLKEITGDINLI